DVSAILRLEHLQPAPGAFHMELNLAWMILRVHRGDAREIGSLQYFISLLAKKNPKPDFETLFSLLEQVLTGTRRKCTYRGRGTALSSVPAGCEFRERNQQESRRFGV
ncbi:hypothetical protein R3P38DRAFT_2527329, partial [Favolaschia claudopus]